MLLELMEGSMHTLLTPTLERGGREDACREGRVGGSSQSPEWSVQDVYGEASTG